MGLQVDWDGVDRRQPAGDRRRKVRRHRDLLPHSGRDFLLCLVGIMLGATVMLGISRVNDDEVVVRRELPVGALIVHEDARLTVNGQVSECQWGDEDGGVVTQVTCTEIEP